MLPVHMKSFRVIALLVGLSVATLTFAIDGQTYCENEIQDDLADKRSMAIGKVKLEALFDHFNRDREVYYEEHLMYEQEGIGPAVDHFLAKDPRNTYASKWLALEQEYRGTSIGLNCLLRNILGAASVFSPDCPAATGRSEALNRLSVYYLEHEFLDAGFSLLDRGPLIVGEAESFLEAAMKSPHRHVRANAALSLASLLNSRANGAATIKQINKLLDPNNREDAEEIEFQIRHKINESYAKIPVAKYRLKADALLELVESKYGGQLKTPSFDRSKPLFALDRTAKKNEFTKRPNKTLGEIAGQLKRSSNLQIGMPALEINEVDVHGRRMKLSDFRGRVTVLMFSFKGCSPCEQMYPENRKLIETHKNEKFSFVGVQFDQNRETTLKSVNDGVITWPVWWDEEGIIKDSWNVTSFPQVFVIDSKGIIRFKDLNSKQLDKAVQLLIDE